MSVPAGATCSNEQRTAHDMSLGVRRDVHLKPAHLPQKMRALVDRGGAGVAACESQSTASVDGLLQPRNNDACCLEPINSRMHQTDAFPSKGSWNLAVERGGCSTSIGTHKVQSPDSCNPIEVLKDKRACQSR